MTYVLPPVLPAKMPGIVPTKHSRVLTPIGSFSPGPLGLPPMIGCFQDSFPNEHDTVRGRNGRLLSHALRPRKCNHTCLMSSAQGGLLFDFPKFCSRKGQGWDFTSDLSSLETKALSIHSPVAQFKGQSHAGPTRALRRSQEKHRVCLRPLHDTHAPLVASNSNRICSGQ